MEEMLINARNRAWVKVILQDAPGRTLVIAVGALNAPPSNLDLSLCLSLDQIRMRCTLIVNRQESH